MKPSNIYAVLVVCILVVAAFAVLQTYSLENAQSDLSVSNGQIQGLQQQVNSLTQQLSTLNQEVGSLNQQISSLTASRDSLQSQLNVSQNSVQSQAATIANQTSQIVSLQNQLMVLNSMISSLQSQLLNATLALNGFTPITPNAGFELNDNSWAIGGSGPGVASIVSGGAASGSRSLYIHDPGQSVYVFYNDTSARVLPFLVNSSIAFGFDLLFKGNAIPTGNGVVWLTLFLSWRLLPNDTFPLTLVLGNYSTFTDSTYDAVNASAGITMVRGIKSETAWTNYELLLGTPRINSLIKGYLQANSSTSYNAGDSVYVVGFRIAADNADAYFDNAGLYNVAPSTVSIFL